MRLLGFCRPRRRRTGRPARAAGLVLMYHRVGHPGVDPWDLAVSPGRFAEQMEVLAREARVVPLADLAVEAERAREARPAVALTFDDGYADTWLTALPILERHGLPATVFLTTGAIGRDREFWWDELTRLVLEPPAPDRTARYAALWERLRAASAGEQEEVLGALAASAGDDRRPRPTHRPLTEAEAAALARHPLVEIGAHTVTHPPLDVLPARRQAHEVRTSRAACEALAGRPVTSFAYPFGRYGAGAVAAVRVCGFARACTTDDRPFETAASPLELPRVHVLDRDGEALSRRLAGAAPPR